MQRLIIEHIESDFAVVKLPNTLIINIPRVILPKEAVEGDVIEITIDKDEVKARKAKIQKKINNI